MTYRLIVLVGVGAFFVGGTVVANAKDVDSGAVPAITTFAEGKDVLATPYGKFTMVSEGEGKIDRMYTVKNVLLYPDAGPGLVLGNKTAWTSLGSVLSFQATTEDVVEISKTTQFTVGEKENDFVVDVALKKYQTSFICVGLDTDLSRFNTNLSGSFEEVKAQYAELLHKLAAAGYALDGDVAAVRGKGDKRGESTVTLKLKEAEPVVDPEETKPDVDSGADSSAASSAESSAASSAESSAASSAASSAESSAASSAESSAASSAESSAASSAESSAESSAASSATSSAASSDASSASSSAASESKPDSETTSAAESSAASMASSAASSAASSVAASIAESLADSRAQSEAESQATATNDEGAVKPDQAGSVSRPDSQKDASDTTPSKAVNGSPQNAKTGESKGQSDQKHSTETDASTSNRKTAQKLPQTDEKPNEATTLIAGFIGLLLTILPFLKRS